MSETTASLNLCRLGAPRRSAGTPPEIPDYTIVRQIGSGAYGEVWLARSLTGAYRAVKIVWREDFDDERSFIREFEGILNYEPLARNHPGLVHILHVGQKNEPTPFYYYVMELADDAQTGININPEGYTPRTLRSDKQLYGNRPMPLDYCIEVGSQLAHALFYLHSEALTHRDVKPANVVFVNGRPKLADIGLVAPADQRSFVGTEGFIPPEGPGTPRADVYALAKVLYEITTGRDRLDFPELPDELPEGTPRKKWLAFNEIICAAAEPRLDASTITTAEQLAEAIDELRTYAPQQLRKKIAGKNKKKTKKPGKKGFPWGIATFGTLMGIGITFAIIYHAPLLQYIIPRIIETAGSLLETKPGAPQQSAPAPIQPQISKDNLEEGTLYITSFPPGASIYTSSGKYLDETPYGPIAQPTGNRVSFTLRKDGYADKHETGIIPGGGVLALGGDLKPYNPPQRGKEWKDITGTVYAPSGNEHVASTPVTAAQFKNFTATLPQDKQPPSETIQGSDIIRTTPEAISAYTLWLTSQCEREGIIGHDHSINAIAEKGQEAENSKLQAYRLVASPVRKTPITLLTNPAGAVVTLNGQMLGVTPMQNVRVPLAPYLLEFKLPGYTTIRKSGLSPKDLMLSLRLEPNNSVVFGQEWINSLGMRFIPINANQLAGATEVRLSDYQTYLNDTKTAAPPAPPFDQNPHHPVVNVNRQQALDFAAWLTKTEREKGIIEANDQYQLPTDAEWSLMVGLTSEQGQTPYQRQKNPAGNANSYPWGTRWPPLASTGNFADQSAIPLIPTSRTIPNYRDGYPYTAPVASYPGNEIGLHDLAGNVQEWVSDHYGGPRDFRFRNHGVLRGGSYESFRPAQLNNSARIPVPPDTQSPAAGFRLMLNRTIVAE